MKNDDLKTMHTEWMKSFHRIKKVNIASIMKVSKGDFFALQIIERYQKMNPEKEGIYVSNLAESLKIASSQTSRMLKNLEERNWVGRNVDPKDRRNTYVFLTEEGKEVCRQVEEKMQMYFQGVWNSMGKERVEELILLCNELADVMESELKKWKTAASETKKFN